MKLKLIKEMKRQQGFTLLELMIAVAILGIISAIAYPSYLEYVRDTRRANATLALTDLASSLERFYTTNNTYMGFASAGVPLFGATQSPLGEPVAEYNLRVTAAAVDSYTIQAQRTGVQAGDDCGTFQLTQTGARSITNQAAGVVADDCW